MPGEEKDSKRKRKWENGKARRELLKKRKRERQERAAGGQRDSGDRSAS